MNIDFEDYPITEEEVISILGNNYKTQGNELVFRCPSCAAVGRDRAADNLKYNKDKHILKCFACDFGAEITGIIARRRFEANKGNGEVTQMPQTYDFVSNQKEEITIEKEKAIPEDKLNNYYWNCQVNLMKRKDILRKMYKKHTILPRTALDCGIGYDIDKDMLVFPSRAIGTNPTESMLMDLTPNGAEYREYIGDKKVRRISGYDSRICCVYGGNFTMNAIICEGYKDAYNLLQILRMTDIERLNYTAIFTVQNGTNSINSGNCLQKVNWKMCDEVYLLMDNDAAGDKATELARDLFPKMKDYRNLFLGDCVDIQEKFEKTFGSIVDIEQALNASWIDEWQSEECMPL